MGRSRTVSMLMFVFCILGATNAAVPAAGLIGYWNFDEGFGGTLYDQSGNGNNGTILSSRWVAGRSGTALEFNGFSSGVNMGVCPSLTPASGVTISVWFKLAAPPDYYHSIVQNGFGYRLMQCNAYEDFGLTVHGLSGGVTEGNGAASSYALDTWYHVVFTFDDATDSYSMIVNGSEKTMQNSTGGGGAPTAILGTTDPFTIGYQQAAEFGASNFFNGVIDDVRIYNRALSMSEALELYTEHSTQTNHAPQFTTSAPTSATTGSPYSYAVGVNDIDGDPVTLSLPTKPSGMTISGSTIRWTPTISQAGTYSVVVRAADNKGAHTDQSYSIVVRERNYAPSIVSSPPLVAGEGDLYLYQVSATDANSGDRITYSLSTKPSGMTINATGLISWTPTAGQVGTANVTVEASDQSGATARQSFSIAVSALNDGPELVAVESPTRNRRPTLAWQAVDGATAYTVQVSTGSSFSTLLLNVPVSATSYAVATDLPIGIIYWRVKADNSEYSSVGTFEILDARIPELIAVKPESTTNRTPTLSWIAADGVSSYTLQVSQQSVFSQTVLSVPVAATSYTPQVALPLGRIFWRVRGDDSDWSPTSSFTILDNRIPTPIPFGPTTQNRTPTLSWHTPEGSVASYTIQIAASSSFSTPLVNAPISDTFYTCLAELPVGTIYWRVRGDDSQYSSTQTFTILDARIPVLIPYEPKMTRERRPTLRWHRVEGAASYTLMVATTAEPANPIVSLPLADTAYTAGADLPMEEIVWMVRSDLVSAWSDPDIFTIVVDSLPLLSTYDGVAVNTVRPEFRWSAVVGATHYKIEIANNPEFTGATSVPLSDTVYVPLSDLGAGVWYWRVSTSRDLALFTPVDSVMIDPDAPVTGVAAASVSPNVMICGAAHGIAVHLRSPSGVSSGVTVYDLAGREIWTAAFPAGGRRVVNIPVSQARCAVIVRAFAGASRVTRVAAGGAQ